MGLKRFTVNRFTNQRFTVPGFGTGSSGPAAQAIIILSFPSTNTWTCPVGTSSIEYMVVAGGGSGGNRIGGGGGAGGYLTGSGLSVVSGTV